MKPSFAAALVAGVLGTTSSPTPQEPTLPIAIARGTPAPAGGRLVEVTIRFDREVPETLEVVRLVRDRGGWRLGDITRRPVSPRTREMRAAAPAGVDTLLLMRAPGHAGYLLDGPFQWPRDPSTYFISARWRRSVRGRWPREGNTALTWLHAFEQGVRDAWPQCAWSTELEWECVGVPLGAPGVVFSRSTLQVSFAVAGGWPEASGVERVEASTASWARLVAVRSPHGPDSSSPPLLVRPWRLERPRGRPAAVRLEVASEDRIDVRAVGPATYWISGSGALDDSWVEISAAGAGAVRITTGDLSTGPADLVLPVYLPPSASVHGRVSGATGVGAAGAVVTLYRFVERAHDQAAKPMESRPLLRIAVGEQRTNEDGEFRFEGLSSEPYELLAMHPTLGRHARTIEADGQPLRIVLSSQRAVGRVLRGGVAAPGVPVAVVPDLDQFAGSPDVTLLRGGEAETDENGRFSVALPAQGSAELRIGGNGTEVRRMPVTSTDGGPAVIDVGTLELRESLSVSLVLEASDGCDILLSGPAGRAGMTLVRAVRLGPAMFEAALPEGGRWLVTASCGSRERPVVPSAITVTAGTLSSVRLTWPR